MLSDRAHTVAIIALVLAASLLSACEPFPEKGVPPFPLSQPRPTAALPTATPTPTRPTPVRVTPLVAAATAPPATPTAGPPDDAWLERAGLGPHLSPEEDAEAMRRQALDEGRVMLYSDSSRGLTSLEAMTEAQPGIVTEAYTWSAGDIVLRMEGDAQQGTTAADVLLVADPVRVHALASRGWLWPYVPPELADVLPQTTSAGLPIHHWSALLPVSGGGAAASIDTWWDLTRPEWAGRVALSDPLVDDRTLYLLAMMVQRTDDMAEAYRAEFEQAPPLDEDCGDAGCLWIRSLFANQPVILNGDADVARWVAEDAGQTRVGLCGYEQYIKVRRGELSFTPLWRLAPTAGLRWPAAVAIVDRAPHPQAAKLAVRWLYGSAGGGQGYAPWLEAGYYPARTDVADPPGALPRDELLARLWEVDPAAVTDMLPALRARIAGYLNPPTD